MKFCQNKQVLSLLVLVVVALTTNISFAQEVTRVRSSEIDQIRNMTLLQQEDMDRLKSYVQSEFDDLFEARDPSDKASNLLKISQSLSRQSDVKQLYSDSFTQAVLESAKKVQAQCIETGNTSVYLQTVIIIAGTDNKIAIPALLEHLKSNLIEVRYWAISGFGTPALTDYLGSDDGKNDLTKISAALNELLANETSANIIGKIAEVAVLATDEGIELLDSCIKKRTQQYQAWENVGNELIDHQVFMRIINTVRSGIHKDFKRREAELMHIASQIYWMAWQRYYLGNSMTNESSDTEISIFVNGTSQNNLLTTLIEGEKQLLAITGEQPDYRMTSNNLINNRWEVLERRVEVLIGRSGAVQRIFEIYGNRTETDLPKFEVPPAKLLKNAENYLQVTKNLLDTEY